jgi:dUTP pyrophosphatase
MQQTIIFEKLSNNAIIPTRAHEGDAGLDLYTPKEYILRPGVYVIIDTCIAVDIPFGYEGQVRGRSGLAFNQLVFCAHFGTIDYGYNGPIKVILQNCSTEYVKLKAGSRIAQLVISSIKILEPVEGLTAKTTDRGAFGFGSTGL